MQLTLKARGSPKPAKIKLWREQGLAIGNDILHPRTRGHGNANRRLVEHPQGYGIGKGRLDGEEPQHIAIAKGLAHASLIKHQARRQNRLGAQGVGPFNNHVHGVGGDGQPTRKCQQVLHRRYRATRRKLVDGRLFNGTHKGHLRAHRWNMNDIALHQAKVLAHVATCHELVEIDGSHHLSGTNQLNGPETTKAAWPAGGKQGANDRAHGAYGVLTRVTRLAHHINVHTLKPAQSGKDIEVGKRLRKNGL